MSNNKKEPIEITTTVKMQPFPVYTYSEKYELLEQAAQRALDANKQ